MERQEDEYMKKLRFRPVATDQEAVYHKVQQRIKYGGECIQYGSECLVGVAASWKYLAIAASVALLVVSSFLYYVARLTPGASEVWLEVSAVAGTKTRVVLPDSTEVWLNNHATIWYPQQFGENMREVAFEGNALFEVRPDKNRPFAVKTDGLRISVLGTRFYLSAPADSTKIETTLLSGSVALFNADHPGEEPVALLKPDEKARYNKVDGSITVQKVHAALYASWVKGDFYFENNTLKEIMESLERAFDVPIHIRSESLRNKSFTAQFVHQESLEEILEILQVSAKYNYRKIRGEIYITEK